jgi:hypothetical protein
MTGPPAALLALLIAAVPLPPSDRIEGERAVERARYAFVIGATKPFDEVYPRLIFEKRVDREIAEERILQRVFGLMVTRQLLEQEFDRIERATKAPERWEAIKRALRDDRGLIEEVFCRPLLIERALRARFDFDQKIHMAAHQKARQARATFLGGGRPRDAIVQTLGRKAEAPPGTDELLRKAQTEASLPRVLAPQVPREASAPVSIDPELARVLERELRKPGDVTTILEERDRFEVFRLISLTEDFWKVEVVRVPKENFDDWFERARRSRS